METSGHYKKTPHARLPLLLLLSPALGCAGEGPKIPRLEGRPYNKGRPASLETQPLTPRTLGDQSCLNVTSSKNDDAFDNDDDSGKDWAQS